MEICLPLLKQIKLHLFHFFEIYIFFYVGLLKHLHLSVNFSLLISLQSPTPSSLRSALADRKKKKKAIDNHTTTSCCRSRPIRTNHSTVGVVARRLFCVWFVAAWDGGQGQLSVCLPACPLPAPWLCLAVLALKGRRHTIGFSHLSITRLKRNQLSFHQHNKIHTAAMPMLGLFFVCGCLKTFWVKAS